MHDDMMNRSPDKHEAAMARADLYKLANYSMKLFKMIHEGQVTTLPAYIILWNMK